MKDTAQPGSLISTALSDESVVIVSVHVTTKSSIPVTCYMLQSMISNSCYKKTTEPVAFYNLYSVLPFIRTFF